MPPARASRAPGAAASAPPEGRRRSEAVRLRLRTAAVLALVPLLCNCATPYVPPQGGPTAQLDLVSHVGGSPAFWHDDDNACRIERMYKFDDDSLQEIGALVQGKPLHAVQSHTVTVPAGRPFLLTASFMGMSCYPGYSFVPQAGEHYEADAKSVCVIRIIHLSTNAQDGSTTRAFEPTAEPLSWPCKSR